MHVIIAAGGTGGHLYPAIALAREFLRQRPESDLVFVGTPRGLETKVLAHEGFPLVLISAQPFMGVGLWGALRGLLALPRGLWQSVRLLSHRKADLVVSVGGYTSPAVVIAAWLRQTPLVLLEPNAYPGMANKALSPLADRVFLAFESAAAHLRSRMVRVVGSPVREEFIGSEAAILEPPHAFAPEQTRVDHRLETVHLGLAAELLQPRSRLPTMGHQRGVRTVHREQIGRAHV